ncbi:hypothetical protein GOQ29_02245 [Clostridium sp. D2Q-14]|uniref:hypothetical protein n=1 Tax=Anaeromonas gelatinilytica TaxID=2683194 RepID=UPI00193C39C7|nr:hypothetical protein [Anaeromonas gelatinilytica]MBS4534431.1 hypothetical protein [Anaeromonas gelatinilytica]
MNKGKFNTLILLSLFIISLLLINKAFLYNDQNLFTSLGDSKKDSSKDLIISKIIYPKSILVNYSEDTHTIINANKYDLWNDSKEVIKDVFTDINMNITEINKDELSEEKNKRSIEVQFPDEFPIKLITKALDISLQTIIEENIEYIDAIYIRLDEKPYVVISSEDKIIKLDNVSSNNVDNIEKTIDYIKLSKDFINFWSGEISLGTKSNVYIPYDMPNDKKNIIVENDIKITGDIEENEDIDKFAEEFFDKDLSYLRKIVDNSGAIVYMYNQNTGLLVYPNGMVEYSNTLDDVVMERNIEESLDTLIDFIMEKDKLPEEAYLSKVEEIEASNNSKGYRFTFDYNINEKTVYINNDRKEEELLNPLIVEVFNDEVKSYRRFYRDIIVSQEIDDHTEEKINPETIIEMNIERIIEEYDEDENLLATNVQQKIYDNILSSIDNISLGYYDKASKYYKTPLIEVCVIDIGENRFMFNTNSGEIVDIEKVE